ncbi:MULTISPECIES: Hpt domain-containing protein [unclassified Marinobacter]|uniref:Hpt domain-containing protein n=1 Tax=unclassified Marinobacter TaxID=83889 RepID=UPI0026E42F42|nr:MULTISPECIES: Hpt domain-containing protein [unclassified Marinobacter]MDO6440814.1 Hpt domain-containing protein [Marinobacter sp. 2_MG-2023]MDO6823642.1 Hpt domain-containing protein [Marinobacter sp. 1_MG-2023]
MVDKPHLDKEALAELRDVMEDEFEMLIQTYLVDSKERIDSLKGAAMAGDSDAFAKTAHSFKGSCINIGAPRLGELCRNAEKIGQNENLAEVPPVLEAIEYEFQQVTEAFGALMERGTG